VDSDGNRVFDWVQIALCEGAILGERACPTTLCCDPCKTAEPIEMPFEVLRDVAMATIFGFLYMGCTLAPPGEYD